MKNQYFGDINDYLKYGLLRCFGDAGLRIGVCWMLTPDDGRSDGRKISYLSHPEHWRPYDPILFDAMGKAIKSRVRDVRHVQKCALLGNALFFDKLVPENQRPREVWLTKTLAKLARAGLFFFDPDNGIEVRSKPNGRRGSDKYLYWHEIRLAWAQGASLLIFQHFPRQNHDQYVSYVASQLAKHVSGGKVIPLITSNVVYLLACQQRHKNEIALALRTIAKRWQDQIRKP